MTAFSFVVFKSNMCVYLNNGANIRWSKIQADRKRERKIDKSGGERERAREREKGRDT